MSQAGRQRLHRVQVLRGIAALLVALLHDRSELRAMFPDRWLLEAPFRGNFGVDIFFVISGFIISHVSRQASAGGGAARHFALNRAARILPLYWTASVVFAVTLLFVAGKRAAPPSLAFLFESLSFIPVGPINSEGRPEPVLPLGWTLNFEVFFYLLFAFGIWRAGAGAWRHACAAILLLVASGLVFTPAGSIARTWTDPLLLEFVFGMLIAQAGAGPGSRRTAWLCLTLGAVGGAMHVAGLTTADQPLRPLVAGLPAAALVFGAVLLDKSSGGTSVSGWMERVGEHLGDYSYSLYLLHLFPLLAMSRLGFAERFLHGAGPWGALLLLLALQIGLAALSYRLLEKPSNRFLTARFGTRG